MSGAEISSTEEALERFENLNQIIQSGERWREINCLKDNLIPASERDIKTENCKAETTLINL